MPDKTTAHFSSLKSILFKKKQNINQKTKMSNQGNTQKVFTIPVDKTELQAIIDNAKTDPNNKAAQLLQGNYIFPFSAAIVKHDTTFDVRLQHKHGRLYPVAKQFQWTISHENEVYIT
jgi:hypothetical protein